MHTSTTHQHAAGGLRAAPSRTELHHRRSTHPVYLRSCADLLQYAHIMRTHTHTVIEAPLNSVPASYV